MVVSYTRFHRNYQADSRCLQIFSRSHQFHSHPCRPPPLCPSLRTPSASLQAFRTPTSSSSSLKSISKSKWQLLADHPKALPWDRRCGGRSAAISFEAESDSSLAGNVITGSLSCRFTAAWLLTTIKCSSIASERRGQWFLAKHWTALGVWCSPNEGQRYWHKQFCNASAPCSPRFASDQLCCCLTSPSTHLSDQQGSQSPPAETHRTYWFQSRLLDF